ncbi:unnamed protein product [Pelagomonas calceolata]|uniref:MYND-type domain-containing protein n=1 Tax=Pelagomonas calceolata TaxID=35677 RepID=A0A8J2SXC1_9STRA|nr:unnamed protein product [Pelagomonas calceolata]
MGRKTAKKKRGAAKNTVPKAAPLVDATVFGGSYSLQVPQGWMHPAEVLASGFDARPSEQFVSRRALSGPGFASLIVDVVPAHIRDLGSPSGKQRLCEFVNYHEEENDATFKAPVEVKSCHDSPFESVWLIEYKSVGKLEGRTTRTMAALLESPEADVILRLNNGDTENVCFPSIVGSLRRVPGAPPPQPHYPRGSGLPVPQTIELDFDELEAVAKDRDVDVEFLWMTAQAMCSSDAELTSMDAAAREKVDTLLRCENFARYRHAALELPIVRRRIEDRQRARISREQASYKAASEPVDDPRARAISVAVAVAKAAAKAIPPHENITENARWIRAVQTLRDAITTDDSDEENFYEYMQSRKYDGPEKYWPHEKMLKFMSRWPRVRKYWPRLRRRICTYCGKRSDLSEPRLLVCGGCAAGRGVGRYCSEACQRADWPEHQEACTLIHTMPDEGHPWMRKVPHTMLFAGVKEAKSAGLSPEGMSEADLADRMLSLTLQYAKQWKSEGKM